MFKRKLFNFSGLLCSVLLTMSAFITAYADDDIITGLPLSAEETEYESAEENENEYIPGTTTTETITTTTTTTKKSSLFSDDPIDKYNNIKNSNTSGEDYNAKIQRFNEISEEVSADMSQMDLTTEDGTITKTASDLSKWIIGEGEPRTTQRNIYIGSDITKVEIFYTTGSQLPELAFVSPSGEVYYSGNDVEYENTIIKTRTGYKVKNHPDISYYVMYFAGIGDDCGTWTMEATIDEITNEFFVLTAQAANEWKTLNEEYKTAPTEIVLWFLDTTKSQYKTNEELSDIISRDTTIPEINNMTPVEEIPLAEESPAVKLLKFGIFLIPVITIGAFLSLRKMSKEKKEHEDRVVKSKNERLQKRKQKENQNLDQFYNKNKYDYSDSFDITKKAKIADRTKLTYHKPVMSKEEETAIKLQEELPSFVDDAFIQERAHTIVTESKIDDFDIDDDVLGEEYDDFDKDYKEESFEDNQSEPAPVQTPTNETISQNNEERPQKNINTQSSQKERTPVIEGNKTPSWMASNTPINGSFF